MKTYTGTIISATDNTVTIAVPTAPNPMGDPGRCPVVFHAASRVAAEAAAMIGRRVQFQAELSERTQCLTQVQLCVRSEFGLRAVAEAAAEGAPQGAPGTRASGVRDLQAQALEDGCAAKAWVRW
jgi:hypothetical protein